MCLTLFGHFLMAVFDNNINVDAPVITDWVHLFMDMKHSFYDHCSYVLL